MWNSKTRIFLMYMTSVIFSVSSETICQAGNTTSCLEEVKRLALSQSDFWFGTQYRTLCPQGADGTLTCSNARPSTVDSIISRMTGDQSFDQNTLKFIVNVTYDLKPNDINGSSKGRNYKGCATTVHTFTNIETFTIDPVDQKMYEPFDLYNTPSVSWPTETGDIFTMIFFDVGYLAIKALSINIKGGTPSDGQVVINYTEPINPLDRQNIYVFAVFRQSSEVNFDHVSSYLTNAKGSQNTIDLSLFMTKFNLTGPVGLNILRVSTDQYAAVEMRRRGLFNNCPRYEGTGFQTSGQFSFIPGPLTRSKDFKVSIDVLYNASAITYQYCGDVSVGPSVFLRDYTTSILSTRAITVRDKPQITFVPKEMQLAEREFAGKKYTLILVTEGKTDLLVHWMVINIPNGNVSSGIEALRYTSPHPMKETGSTYYVFLLYKQNSDLTVTETKKYAGTDCIPAEVGRCNYRVADFIKEKGLKLIGLRQSTVYQDNYSCYLQSKLKLKNQDDICHGRRVCQVGSANKMTAGCSLAFVLTILALMLTCPTV